VDMCTMHGGSSLALLQAGLAELDGADANDLTDGQVRAEVAALLAAVNQLTAVLSVRVGVFDARDLSTGDGFKTTRSWLVAFGRMTQGAATGWLHRARLLRELPALAAAAGQGTVSAEHLAKVYALAHRVGFKETAAYDEILAELSSQKRPVDTQRACERIAAHLDPDGAPPDPERDFERREITFSRLGSMLYVKGRLDAEGGAALMTVVDAWMRPPGPGDTRTAAQRRADALVDIARDVLNRGDAPTVAGVRPHLGILITPAALLGPNLSSLPTTGTSADLGPASPAGSGPPTPADAGAAGGGSGGDDTAGRARVGARGRPAGAGRADPLTEAGIPPVPEPPWLQWIGDIPPELAQRIACDSDVWRIVLDPATGLPLDVGRKHRIVPHWIRKALHARDRTCRWPACDVPAPWTDAHHETPWYCGGETNVDELISMCRHHHVLTHEGRWTIRLDHTTGEIHVTRPDGRPYELGPSQPYRPTG
jgi:Domain of unknown function (DUF222)